jgi:hypothetical protein
MKTAAVDEGNFNFSYDIFPWKACYSAYNFKPLDLMI